MSGTPAAASTSDLDGTLSATVSGQVVTITRSGGSAFTAGAIDDLTLTNIKNPITIATTGTFTITTTDASDNTVDTLASITGIAVTGGAISSVTITPADTAAGATSLRRDADRRGWELACV